MNADFYPPVTGITDEMPPAQTEAYQCHWTRRFFILSHWRACPPMYVPSSLGLILSAGLPAMIHLLAGLPTNVSPSVVRIDIIGGLAHQCKSLHHSD
jgi:hypothetical protein